jgi:hypothetical protein
MGVPGLQVPERIPNPEPATLLTPDLFVAPDATPSLGGDPAGIPRAPSTATTGFMVLRRVVLPAIPRKIVS